MRIRPLIVALPFEAYGVWRFVMDVLGDADIVRSLMEEGAWLHAYGPILIGLSLIAWAFWPGGNKKAKLMSSGDKPVVGLDIENSGGGIGMDIQSHGKPGAPSTGAEVNVAPVLGRDAVGVRVVQSGPGTGMRIVQSGPGVGLRISVGGSSKHEPKP